MHQELSVNVRRAKVALDVRDNPMRHFPNLCFDAGARACWPSRLLL